ncbi:MAG: dehydrogenase [Desulfobacterales bacterium]|nr:dehydrogenase [Desulfobacterales bacterium]
MVSINYASPDSDRSFVVEFLNHQYEIFCFGANGDLNQLVSLLTQWDKQADVIGIGGINYPWKVGSTKSADIQVKRIQEFSRQMRTPVTFGESLRRVSHDWSIKLIQFKLGNNFFDNAITFLFSGLTQYNIALGLSEYTENFLFADPVLELNIPKCLHSLLELEIYAKGLHDVLSWVPGKKYFKSKKQVFAWNKFLIAKALQKAHIIGVPQHGFHHYVQPYGLEEFGGKAVISSTVDNSCIKMLHERGVYMIIDPCPKVFDRVLDFNIMEALMVSYLGKTYEDITDDDFLEIISELRMEPRIIYPSGNPKRVNRFAFVIHPLSQEQLSKAKPVEWLSKLTPDPFMDTIEMVIAYSPPFIYSKVTGIQSPTGVEAEGWLLSVGGTPRQMLSHHPDFTYQRLLQAARMAKRLGAQIMGLGAFTKIVGDAGVTVAKLAEVPITTGNSYSASATLWAAADAVRRMGIIQVEGRKKLKAKTMVIGATGSIGSVCARLLAMAFEEVYMVGRDTAKLLALKESILQETPDSKLHVSIRADKYITEMDVIVLTTSAAGHQKILDIMKVKPGCVITDVTRPLDLSRSEVAKRPDVLVIESGEIELPGNPIMRNIGLPAKIAYACLAETIVLALEGRFENYTIGRNIEWQKVKDIYKMGLKHGMKLAAISGKNGVFTDEDIQRVKELALKARNLEKNS